MNAPESKYAPRAGDLVEFPVHKEGQTKWVAASFEATSNPAKLMVVAGSAPHLVDDNFREMFNMRYVGATADGKRKFTVFHKPRAEQSHTRFQVRLDVGRETVITTHKARTAVQAMTFAAIKWCNDNQLPAHQHAAFISRFQKGEPGYDYTVKSI